MDTEVSIRYPNRKILKTTRYEPTFQEKRYEYNTRAVLLKYGYRLISTSNKEEYIEKLLGVIMAKQYFLKAVLKRFVSKD